MAIPKISELYDSILLFFAEYGENELSEIRKDVIEVYFEKKGEKTDGFTIIINANGNMYFVPPEYLRTDKNGQVYWIAYDIYINRENED